MRTAGAGVRAVFFPCFLPAAHKASPAQPCVHTGVVRCGITYPGPPPCELAARSASGEPFALAAITENWKISHTEERMRTSCIITTAANELVGQIHDRMPMISTTRSLTPLAGQNRARPA